MGKRERIGRHDTSAFPRWLLWIILCAVLLRMAVAVISHPYVQNLFDLHDFYRFGLSVVEGESSYKLYTSSLYPPLWHFTMGGLIVLFGPFWNAVLAHKALLILFDAMLLLLIYRLAVMHGLPERQIKFVTIAYAFHPVALMIIGVHGQLDSVTIFFTVFAVYLLEMKHETGAALSLGAGIAIKLLPLFLLPCFLLHKSVRRRISFLAFAALPSAVTLLPFLFPLSDGYSVITQILNRASISIGGAGTILVPLGMTAPVFSRMLTILMLLGVTLAAWRARRWPLIVSVFIGFLAIAVFISTWGVNYSYWLVPFSLLVWSRWSLAYSVLATMAGVMYYGSNFVKAVPLGPLTPDALMTGFFACVAIIWLLCIGWLVAALRGGAGTRRLKRWMGR